MPPIALPGTVQGPYRTLLADPPWAIGQTGKLRPPYPLLSLDAICRLPVQPLVARDAHLWLVVLTDLKVNTPVALRPPSDRLIRPRPRRITNRDRARAVELYERGLSLNAVARQLGVSRQVVKTAVELAGLPVRDRYGYRRASDGPT